MCVCMCGVSAVASRGQKRALNALELDLQVVGSHPMSAGN